MKAIFGYLLFFVSASAYGAEKFTFEPSLISAYNDILALRIQDGNEKLAKEKTDHPANPLIAFVEDYSDFFTLLIDENRTDFQQKKKFQALRITAIKKGDRSSPYYAFCQAEIILHWAVLKIKFGDYLDGVTDIKEAYSLLESNIRSFPNFKPQYKSMGMLEVLIGTVPSNYQWVTQMIGMKGSIQGGMQKISAFIEADFVNEETEIMKQEAVFVYAFLQMHIVKNKTEAWSVIEKNTSDYSVNLLKTYVRAAIALQCNKTDEAIKTLSQKPRRGNFYPFYYLDYLMGLAKLHRMDTDADVWFKIYVTYFKGENYIKDAYLKLAWCSLLNNKIQDYQSYLLLVKSRGKENFDEDKQALREAQSTDKPDITLLKARLFFDGGYYDRSLEIIQLIDAAKLPSEKQKTELEYRKGRLYHEKGDLNKAIYYYKITIEKSAKQPWYFAANASLQLGLIYEQKGWYAMARDAYEKATQFPTQEYRHSIDQKSKAGIKRLEGK